MRLLTRFPGARWVAPVAAAALLVGGGVAVGSVSASADSNLPERTAGQLLVDVQQARLEGLSGTVVQKAELGLPDLPGVGGADSSDLTSLVSGTHTMRVWYSGPDKARLALLGTLGESDVIKNGKDTWKWDSEKNTAVYYRASAADKTDKGTKKSGPTDVPKTPQEAADAALQAIGPSTEVTTTDNASVAGRSAYELVLKPKDRASLISEVKIAIDGMTHIPTRVQVLADGQAKPAFEVGFTAVNFSRPDNAQFDFNPPPGAKVTEGKTDAKAGADQKAEKKADHETATHKVVGKGWTSVIVASMPAEAASADKPGQDDQSGNLQQMLNSLPKVSGSWGSGHLLAGTAFSVLITDENTLVAGAVKPEALYAALGSR